MLQCRSMSVRCVPQQRMLSVARRGSVNVQAALSAAPDGWMSKHRFADWKTISKELTDLKLLSVSPQQAQKLAAEFQYLIVDVRGAQDFETAHPEGSSNAPLFSLMDWEKQRGDVRAVLKYITMISQGVTPVFLNTDFAQDVQAIAKGYRGVIIACESGGTLEVSANFPSGKVSRSLKAAHRVLADPNNKLDVKHMTAGVFGWYKAELPFEGDGEFDESNVGRTPNAAYNGLLTDFKKGEGC